ncbi:MAG: hypothetical protein K2P51_07485 [Rhabdochlamydiaceae bacterium]|nr:hypothetical protein [Rhabdochlamydiaceae bacterium]
MRKLIVSTVCFALVCQSLPVMADDGGLSQYKTDTEALYQTGSGAQEGAFTAISTSMLGWGVGLAVGIAILASVLHQSTASTTHSHSHTCH